MIGRPGPSARPRPGGARATLDAGHQEPRYSTHGAAIAAECARRARLEFAAEARVRQPDAAHVTLLRSTKLQACDDAAEGAAGHPLSQARSSRPGTRANSVRASTS